jgi:hypothetical protein
VAKFTISVASTGSKLAASGEPGPPPDAYIKLMGTSVVKKFKVRNTAKILWDGFVFFILI